MINDENDVFLHIMKDDDGYIGILKKEYRENDYETLRTDSKGLLAGRWITINGSHVLVGRGGVIRKGARGKFNGMPYKRLGKKNRIQTSITAGAASRDYKLRERDTRTEKGQDTSGVEAQKAYTKSRLAEPRITKDMQAITASINAQNKTGTKAYMDGLTYSVKTAKSVKSKIIRQQRDAKSKNNPIPTPKEIVEDMGDLVRYTQMVPHNKIAESTGVLKNQLEKRGYKVVEIDNKYLDKTADYKGMHLSAVSPEGQVFELQVHSKESMAVKMKNHTIYEKSRMMEKGSPERVRLENQMKANTATLKDPENIESIQNIPKPKIDKLREIKKGLTKRKPNWYDTNVRE